MSSKLNLLMAFPYMKGDTIRLLVEQQDQLRLVVDSGAFTAWKSGKAILLDDYCRFIESLPVKPWRYFTLDVVGDPKGTLTNYQEMLKRGFTPIPIFTRGEDPSVMDEYYKTSDVVGVGGLVATPQNKGFVKGIMTRVRGRKVHWLGFTNLDFLKTYRPYMADSSSWSAGAQWGNIPLYMGKGRRFVALSQARIERQIKNPEIVRAIQSYGIDPNALLNKNNWRNMAAASYLTRRLGGRSARRLSEDVEKNLGTYLFLAGSCKSDCELLLETI